MAEDSNYNVPFRRRRKQKTDYQRRLKLLKSGKPRAVIRISNNHTRVQISNYNEEGDENTAQTLSKELENHGWEKHKGNLPAAYLTGYLAGMKTETEKAVLDMGLKERNKGGRVFAAVKGLRDAGVNVPVGEEMLPTEKRTKGEHIEEMKQDEEIVENFETVKENIKGEHE